MRFSWRGVILAPLLVPVLFSVVLGPLLSGSVFGILVLLVPSCVISYGTTIFLFLPCLFVLSAWGPLTGFKVCLLGLLLGTAMWVPVTLLFWASSGPDSGPPAESFLSFALHWAADPTTAAFPLAGLITAGLYWWLVTRQDGRATPVPQQQA
jgi:hypothetical protein